MVAFVPLESSLGPLAPQHLSELIVGVILVGLIWLVMRKAVVPAFEKLYAERADQITGGLERAAKAQAEADAALASYREQLDSAREEAAGIREDAKTRGAQIMAESRDKASEEAARLLEQARTQIDAERTQASQQLRHEVGGLATTLAGRIVGQQLADDAVAKNTVDQFIADLERSAAQSTGQSSGQAQVQGQHA